MLEELFLGSHDTLVRLGVHRVDAARRHAVAPAEGSRGEEVASTRVHIRVVIAILVLVVQGRLAEGLVAHHGGNQFVDHNMLPDGNGPLASLLEELLVVPGGILALVLVGTVVVFATEDIVDDVDTIILLVANVTCGRHLTEV